VGKKKYRRSYSEEFKANAVKMSLKPGVSVSRVAEELVTLDLNIPPEKT
jgi:transposase-like protein